AVHGVPVEPDRLQQVVAVLFRQPCLVPARAVVALLWVIAFLLGALEIFSFAAWASVPSRVARVRPENIGTALGRMLTVAAVGGFAVPAVFGRIVGQGGYTAGWVFLGAVTAATTLVGFAGRDTAPTPVVVKPSAGMAELGIAAARRT
ncbi:hypothetical protein, partial [Streptomyces prunicolor]|uniref:hypothetical protein n=1 Tax=Streptomyces prunicolor TaxID=67348 RepID=UPI0033C5EC26